MGDFLLIYVKKVWDVKGFPAISWPPVLQSEEGTLSKLSHRSPLQLPIQEDIGSRHAYANLLGVISKRVKLFEVIIKHNIILTLISYMFIFI